MHQTVSVAGSTSQTSHQWLFELSELIDKRVIGEPRRPLERVLRAGGHVTMEFERQLFCDCSQLISYISSRYLVHSVLLLLRSSLSRWPVDRLRTSISAQIERSTDIFVWKHAVTPPYSLPSRSRYNARSCVVSFVVNAEMQ